VKGGDPDDPEFNLIRFARECYDRHAHKAFLDLMEFLNGLFPGDNPLCMTYFDEAHKLGDAFWMLMHLLQAQASSMRIWYVFMGMKSSISYLCT